MDDLSLVDPRIDGSSAILLLGQSGSGKTFLSVRIALERNKIFKQEIPKVVIFHQHFQSIFQDAVKQDDSIVLVQNKEDLENELEPHCLLVADDFLLKALESKDNDYVTRFFIERCHHDQLVLLFQTQMLFAKGVRPWSLNTSHYIFLKSFNHQNIERYFRNFSDPQFLFEAYKLATKDKPFSHFFVSFHPNTAESLRYRSSIIPGLGVEIYRPRND